MQNRGASTIANAKKVVRYYPKRTLKFRHFQASKAKKMSPRNDVQELKKKSLVTMQINEDHLR